MINYFIEIRKYESCKLNIEYEDNTIIINPNVELSDNNFKIGGTICKTVYFTPKTLDYAEIMKIQSDSFIKANADIVLADEVKNLKQKEMQENLFLKFKIWIIYLRIILL